MMFEIRKPDERDAALAMELLGQRLADELRERVRALRPRGDRLVDRREVRRPVERQAQDRLAGRPDHPPDAGRDGGLEDVPGGDRVDPERLVVGSEAGAGIAAEVDDRVGATDDVVDLAGVGEVGQRRTA